jgi:hypothetical protein
MTDLPFLDKEVQYSVTIDLGNNAYVHLGHSAIHHLSDYPSVTLQNRLISIARAYTKEKQLTLPRTIHVFMRTSFSVGI